MTLVVGCATPDIGFLVADTLLSFPFYLKARTGPVNGENHALKIQVLNPTTAVAFAGDVEASLDLIHTLHAKLSADPMIDPCEQLCVVSRVSREDIGTRLRISRPAVSRKREKIGADHTRGSVRVRPCLHRGCCRV
jgi:hypothetical protein